MDGQRKILIAGAVVAGLVLVWLGLQNTGRSHLLGTNNPDAKSEPFRSCDPAIEEAVGESLKFSVLTTAVIETPEGLDVYRGFTSSSGTGEALCKVRNGKVEIVLNPEAPPPAPEPAPPQEGDLPPEPAAEPPPAN